MTFQDNLVHSIFLGGFNTQIQDGYNTVHISSDGEIIAAAAAVARRPPACGTS